MICGDVFNKKTFENVNFNAPFQEIFALKNLTFVGGFCCFL